MNIIKTLVVLSEDSQPSSPREVIDALSHFLVGKKITAFGPKGKGLWGDHHEVQTYRIKRVVAHLGPMEDGEPAWGNIDIHLDGYHAGGKKGTDAKGNPTILGGLIYTDKTFENHLKELLRNAPVMKYIKSLHYSEQGMQGKNSVNMDIDFNTKALLAAIADNHIRNAGKVKEEVVQEAAKKITGKNKKVVGDSIRVKASKFLGTPAATGIVKKVNKDGTYGVEIEGEEGLCDIDTDGTCLVGPPLHGKLVRAG